MGGTGDHYAPAQAALVILTADQSPVSISTMKCAVGVALLLVSCGGSQATQKCDPKDTTERIAKLLGSYSAEIMDKCSTYESYEACPDHDDIEARFEAQRTAIEDCK